MENQFERTFAGIFLNTDSLIAKIDSLSRGYEDYYTETLDRMINDTEPPQKQVDGKNVLILLSIFPLFLTLGAILTIEPLLGFVEDHFGIIMFLVMISPLLFWFMRRKFVKNTKSNIDLSFFLVSRTIAELEDLYKNYFLRSTTQTSDYLTSTQEILDFFNSSRIYFDGIRARIMNFPSTTKENDVLLYNIKSEIVEWFSKLLSLNILFLTDWISKTKIELQKLREIASNHAHVKESKENALGKLLLVSLEEQKEYFEQVESQVRLRVQ